MIKTLKLFGVILFVMFLAVQFSRYNTNYYEKLIKDYLLNNNHKTILIVEPVENLAEEK